MAGAAKSHKIDTPTARGRLKPRSEPYWRQVNPGCFLGYRKSARIAAWIVRQRSVGRYVEQRIGTPDDGQPADGELILSFSQAVDRARSTRPGSGGTEPGTSTRPTRVGEPLRINDLVAQYHAHRASTPGGRGNRVMSPEARAVSEANWNRNGATSIGTLAVATMTADALRRWHAAIPNSPPTNRGRAMQYDPHDHVQLNARRQTANRVLTIVKAALNLAWQQDLLPGSRDWWRSVKPFKVTESDAPRMLDSNETTRLLNACPSDLRELVTVALLTGARAGELRALKVGAYSAETGTLRIHQTKSGKTLVQPLTLEGTTYFDRLTAGRMAGDTLLRRENGEAWAKADYRRPLQLAATAAMVADVSFKTLRATYGKMLLLATKDIELVAKALGHSDSRITRKHYAQYLPSELATGVAKMLPLGVNTDGAVTRLLLPA